jgi:serine/threonine-protein kinase HipA
LKLNVHVLGRHVGVLEQVGDFKCVMAYVPDVAPENLVSLTMPVRTESYPWDDQLHPIFQMNLPEGYLLQVLQEECGPHIGASPVALLSVVGRNMVGRLQVAPPGAALDEPAKPIEVAELLKGDNSGEAFSQLVREHAKSGVSGVLPKFLDTEQKKTRGLEPHRKTSLLTHDHIIKGSCSKLPFATANEHLCMQVAARVVESAKTQLSEDGNVLVVRRFDVDDHGTPFRALEDFCALLGLRPSAKYETTWERIAKAVRTYVPGGDQRETFQKLTTILLLTYALRNADCHSKNLALLSSRADASLAPAYDFFTTSVYEGYQDNPPGISFMGRKTWVPGTNLGTFVTSTFAISQCEQKKILERISDAAADTAPAVRELMQGLAGFKDTGKRMLAAWSEGVRVLRDSRMCGLSPSKSSAAFEGFSGPAETQKPANYHRPLGAFVSSQQIEIQVTDVSARSRNRHRCYRNR